MSSIYVVESGACLHKDGGCLLVENKSVKVKYPLESVENIMLCSTAQISSELLQYLMRKNIPVVWLDGCGRYLGSVQTPSSIDIKKHLQQVRLLWKRTTYNEMAKKIIKAKTNSQIVVLRRYNRSATSEKVVAAIKAIYAIAKNIGKCEDYQKLMGYEGVI
ncbi:MAG: CRISPR-associated endonuclease Cas1, partial [Phascolarctobacterium sp.]|nr:CRISPR-associated endonuclease Cas1 [Candidatus Phascolarctobacterium caballi]